MTIEERIAELQHDRALWKEHASRALREEEWEWLQETALELVRIEAGERELERFSRVPYVPVSGHESNGDSNEPEPVRILPAGQDFFGAVPAPL